MNVIEEIRVVTTPEEIHFETQKGALEGAFLRAAGSQQTFVVAGACFDRTLEPVKLARADCPASTTRE